MYNNNFDFVLQRNFRGCSEIEQHEEKAKYIVKELIKPDYLEALDKNPKEWQKFKEARENPKARKRGRFF